MASLQERQYSGGPVIFGIMSGCYPGRGGHLEPAIGLDGGRGMGPHLMDVVVEGKRYRTAAATLLASGPTWDERLGNEPRRLLEVRVGGVDLSAIVGGRGWERPFCSGRRRATTSCSFRALGPASATGSFR
jgi:hypothetical protein